MLKHSYKFVTSLALIVMIILNSSNPLEAQDFSDEDHTTTFVVLLGSTLFAVAGIASISHKGYLLSEKYRALNESELIEARDQLLEYQAKGESGLEDHQLEYLYPMLNRYINYLKRAKSDNKSRSNDELIEIAVKDLLGSSS